MTSPLCKSLVGKTKLGQRCAKWGSGDFQHQGRKRNWFPRLPGQQDWKLVVFGQIRYSVTVGSSSGQSQLDPESGQLSILNAACFFLSKWVRAEYVALSLDLQPPEITEKKILWGSDHDVSHLQWSYVSLVTRGNQMANIGLVKGPKSVWRGLLF